MPRRPDGSSLALLKFLSVCAAEVNLTRVFLHLWHMPMAMAQAD
jgi:hypothetical protein